MTGLAGKVVLVAEDESLIGLDLAQALAEAGAIVLGPYADLDTALTAVALSSPSAAIIDWRLTGISADSLATVLAAKDVPFVVHSGLPIESHDIGAAGDVVVLPKPAPANEIIERLEQLLTKHCLCSRG